jgi:hypothetical protein
MRMKWKDCYVRKKVGGLSLIDSENVLSSFCVNESCIKAKKIQFEEHDAIQFTICKHFIYYV